MTPVVTDAAVPAGHAEPVDTGEAGLELLALDGLGARAALLAGDGMVVTANRTWASSPATADRPPVSSAGDNYLAACDRAAGVGDATARALATVIRTVLDGTARRSAMPYQSPVSTGSGWYLFTAVARRDGAIVSHVPLASWGDDDIAVIDALHHDALTGAPNAALLRARLQHSLDAVRRLRRCAGVISVDLDNLGRLIADHSISSGTVDEIVLEVFRRLRAAVRPADTVARHGVARFVIACENVTHASLALVAQRLVSLIRLPVDCGRETFTVTASIGATLVSGAVEPDAAVASAASAATRAREAGGNRWTMGPALGLDHPETRLARADPQGFAVDWS